MNRTRKSLVLAALTSGLASLGVVGPSRAAAMPGQYRIIDLGPSYTDSPTPATAGDYTIGQTFVNHAGGGSLSGNYLHRGGGDENLLPQDLQGILNPNRDGSHLTYFLPTGGVVKVQPSYLQDPIPWVGGVNSLGHVFVELSTFTYPSTNFSYLFYARETGQRITLQSLPGQRDSPSIQAINDRDQLVGSLWNRAIFYSSPNSVPVELTSLIGNSSGWNLSSASSINNQGEILGQGFNPDGKYTHYKLEPEGLDPVAVTVPEPTTLSSFTLAVLIGLARSWRWRRGASVPLGK